MISGLEASVSRRSRVTLVVLLLAGAGVAVAVLMPRPGNPFLERRTIEARERPSLGGPSTPDDSLDHYGLIPVSSQEVAGVSADPFEPVPKAALDALADEPRPSTRSARALTRSIADGRAAGRTPTSSPHRTTILAGAPTPRRGSSS